MKAERRSALAPSAPLPFTTTHNTLTTDMPVRDNITAPVSYTALSSMRFDPSERVTVTVTGGAIYAQFATVDPPGGLYPAAYDYDVEERVMPVAAIYNWTPNDFRGRKIVGIRVRRKIATDTPQVTLDA